MKPVNFKLSTGTLTGSRGVRDLPVWRGNFDGDDYVASCWKVNWRDLVRLMFGGRVWFITYGETHAPIMLATEIPFKLKENT